MTPKQFKKFRLSKGWSQTRFANELGLRRYQTVLEMETGKIPITKRTELMVKFIKGNSNDAEKIIHKPKGAIV